MKLKRSITPQIKKDLKDKMILVGGPRQVGKTTLAKEFIKKKEQYLSWDDLKDRKILKKHDVSPELKVIVLDEIHKYARWRTLLKGLYDKHNKELKIIVTGSAKLDHFRKGGDSLFGRFFYFRLHPLSLKEVSATHPKSTLTRLLKYGGFPEPFLKANEQFHRRWLNERKNRVVYQDINDLSSVKEISMIELLVDILPQKVGSLLSIKSIQEDLEVSPNTISKWIQILEQVYYCFRIDPYGPKKIRALKKTSKLYLWDWSELESEGAKFENLVASHLLKFCHYNQDVLGHKMELRYLRDSMGREIDFIVLKNKKPLFAVECKTGEKSISKSLYYFRDRIEIPKYYQVHTGTKVRQDRNIHMLPFEKFCDKEKLV